MCHTDFYMYNHNATYIVSDTTIACTSRVICKLNVKQVLIC